VAAVGLTESMMMILYAIAMGVSIGVMALVARRVGEKDVDAAGRTAAQGIVLGLVIAAAIGVAGAALAPELMRAMGADDGVVAAIMAVGRRMAAGLVTDPQVIFV